MTRNLKLLSNFVEKFFGTIKFGNDQIALILGYGDLVQDLEVAFRKSTCYIHDLKGNDLLTSSRGTYLYSITLQDTNSPNPICLMAKASSCQAWLKQLPLHVLLKTVHSYAPDKCQQQNTTLSTSTTIAADTPPLNILTTPEPTSQAPTQAQTVTDIENINQAEIQVENAQVEEDGFFNICSTPVHEQRKTSS
ncbi:hypothetical protein Tco_1427184 [Tanacetum coccineum]